MTMIEKFFSSKISSGLLIMRIIIGLIFFLHGIAKFNMGMTMVAGFFSSVGVPAAGFFAWIVTLLETFGGIALILGIGTRVVSLLLGISMIIATFITIHLHIPFISTETVTGSELNLALLASLIPIVILGPGRYSLARYIIIKEEIV